MSEPEFLLYQTEAGTTRLLVRLQDETIWLSQAQMAELFQTSKQNISLHIRNIFEEGELAEISVVKEYLTTAADGKRYSVLHYNLDVIISVGYRVRSHIGTQFRIWATQRLREYIVKGFVLDDQRLKEQSTTADYFDELLERIRDIRSSEKHLYKRVREICALSLDYDSGSEESKRFFQIVQNKLHYAAAGLTAAEIIKLRVDHNKQNMGLTTWSGDTVRKKDISIAKNYLTHEEITTLNLLVAQYLDFADLQARSRREMRMSNWVTKLDDILSLNDRPVLQGAGSVSKIEAQALAETEYEAFSERRRGEREAAADPIEDLRSAAKALDRPTG
ncbi:MAG: virulence RhuM family protein [Fimbriimonas sp.]